MEATVTAATDIFLTVGVTQVTVQRLSVREQLLAT